MTILITKQNIPFFMDLTGLTKADFRSETEHTCTFKISESDFEALYIEVKKWGNPYAMMTWWFPCQKKASKTLNLNYTGRKNLVYISNINMEIESQDLAYLQSRGFRGTTFEEALKWFAVEHSLTPIRQETDQSDLKQLIMILKIRSI